MKDMTKFINYIIGFILLIMCIMNIVLVKDLEEKTVDLIELSNSKSEVIVLDSIEHDTVFINYFDTVKLETIKKDTISKLDSIFILDSVEVFVPINTYKFDTTLNKTHINLICEGFDVRLNSLLVENLKVPTIEQKAPKRWYEDIHLGVGLSVAYIDKFRLVPTFGIYYKLF